MSDLRLSFHFLEPHPMQDGEEIVRRNFHGRVSRRGCQSTQACWISRRIDLDQRSSNTQELPASWATADIGRFVGKRSLMMPEPVTRCVLVYQSP